MFNKLKCHYFLLILVGIVLFSFSIKAKQLHFQKQEVENGYVFNYQWLDHNKNKQTLKFTLNNESLFERFRHFKSYNSLFAYKSIYKNLKNKLKEAQLPEGIQVHFHQRSNQISLEIKGSDTKLIDQAYEKISTLKQEVTNQYYLDNYYHKFISHNQVIAIKINHGDVANASVADLKALKPLILKTVPIQKIRQVVNFILGFVQSIPYSTLESRVTSSGTGFNPPLKLLWENQGDCDSKMTLTAALFRSLMPRIKIALIYIENHAFIGLNIPVKGNDIKVTHQGITYVLAEPTGPALLKLGTIAPESELAIDQNEYVIETYHANKI